MNRKWDLLEVLPRKEVTLRNLHCGKWVQHISQDFAAATSIFIHVTVLKSEGAQNYTNTDLYLISAKIQSQFLSQQEIAMHWWDLGYGTILKESRFITST